MLTYNEKVWIGIFGLCTLFWMSLAAAGVYAVV
ncbi:hypothetical protein ROSI111154_10630 [Rouxiella silvae]